MKDSALWYRFLKSKFSGSEPRYFNTSSADWAQEIEKRFPVLQKEVLHFVEHHLPELKDYRFHIADGKPQWQTFSLLAWGYVHSVRANKLPLTWNVFKGIKGITSVSISRLIAGTTIPAHHGDTNAIYRCHLGIRIPAGAPECAFVVEEEVREWKDGKILSFCDARFHYAKNLSPEDRYVILFDVIRSEFAAQYYSVCASIIATHFLYMIDMKLPFYDRSPVWLLRMMMFLLSPVFNLLLRLQHLLFGFKP
jgi:aspartyl/asparaginyl beta-hydroxylase (cupin superfamily)